MPITKTKSPPSGGNSFDCYPAIINKERTLANLEQPSRSYELGRLARRPVMTECGLNGDVEDGTLRRLDFFQNVSNTKTRDVVASIIELAKKIGAKTIAEGIENSEQLDFLRMLHCDMIQGYIFSKPLSVPDFEMWRHNRG